ncbi:MAG: hypothetical protein K2P81_13710 [Bacteriovoracaceae bacterium]|nr:hypothetical protein [Bacteriovoracaceae bacterium]
MRLILSALFALIFSAVAGAQSTLTQNLSANKLPTYSGNLALGYNSNFYNSDTYSAYRTGSADLTLNYRVKDANIIRTYIGGYKEVDQGQENKLNDGFIGWVNNSFWHRAGKLTIGQQVRISLPYSKDSRVRDTKLTGVTVVPVFMVNVAPAFLFIYQPQVTKNFHTYTVNRAGTNNTEYAMNHTFVGSWSINDNWYFQPVFVYGNSWTYKGGQKDPTYQVSGELGRSIGHSMTLAAGWANSGAIRRFQNGSDQNIQAFDNKTASYYAALYWIF